jgi:uncharacterized membrane protein (UPF0127 family)
MSPYFRFCFISIVIFSLCLGLGCSVPLSQTEMPQTATASELQISEVKPTPEGENLGQELPITAKAIIKGETIDLEIARSSEEQAIGLMYRRELASNRGMLFPFSEPIMAKFWMKNCLISLDMVFVRGDRVKNIAENVPPCEKDPCPVYNAGTFVDKVIELRAGRAKELNLKKGDTIEIQYLDNSH